MTIPAMGAGAKVLVADDDAALVSTLTWILKEHGYQVVAVPNGEGLLERLQEERPDLVLLDIMMPRVDGLQLLQRIRAEPGWKDLPVLMVSSMPPEDGTVKSLEIGASDFVAKPFRMKELLARVEAHLKRGRELRAMKASLMAVTEDLKQSSSIVDILHEVTDSLKPDEIYHILSRRVARALGISKCSIVLAQPGDTHGTVVAAFENPMLRNLRVDLARYPEIIKALETGRTVIVEDVLADPLFEQVRAGWERDRVEIATRSAIALPFRMKEVQTGVLYLRSVEGEKALTAEDAEFADQVIRAAISALEKAHDFATVVSDRERLEQLASTDALTGCLNRRALIDTLERELDRARRYSLVLTILMVDLDHFKQINDTMGHLVGDTVLRQLGDLLLREVRSVDAVARYGGEEFVVVLPETAVHGAMVFAERMRQRISQYPFGDAGTPVRVTVSIGLASYPDPKVTTPETFLAAADTALYRAKADGRNLVRL
ncbi:MAG TPA: diguanylate cyclase [Gemmatimonadales bacterium]|nr:diguanylate cyclase [Gemmatimonadales bacterium]